MSYKIEEIEGIGPSTAKKLATAKIMSTEDLLEQCANPAGRKAVAETTGIGESQVLKLTNMADLMRVKGVGGEFAELLKNSGVDTVKELATRNAQNLAAKMAEVNEEKKLTRTTPSASEVEKWVAGAKELPPRLTY